MPKKGGKMAGILYLCATPIGNLEDITFRVLRTLKEVDLIAAEDTRNSIKLLNHFEISTPMTSYHEFNKIEKAYQLVSKLKEGKNIALITDAGTPGISDPGEDIVRICYEEGIEVTSLPPSNSGRKAFLPRYHPHLPLSRYAFGANTPQICNGITRQALLESSGCSSWGKARYRTQAAPTIPLSLCVALSVQGDPIIAFAYCSHISIST